MLCNGLSMNFSADDEFIMKSFRLAVTLPDWQYVCIDLDLAARRLDLYVNDTQLTALSSADIWRGRFPANGVQLASLRIYNEKDALVNLFSEPFRPGTCGQNGSLLAWPAIMAGMQPAGCGKADLAAICGRDHSLLVYVPFYTSYDTATENCHKMAAGGHFPVYSSFEVRVKLRTHVICSVKNLSESNQKSYYKYYRYGIVFSVYSISGFPL